MGNSILLVGCGKMGGALLTGWLERGTADAYHVVEPSDDSAAALPRDARVHRVTGIDDLQDDLAPAAVMFAVKPQIMADVVPAYRRFARPGTVFVSIAAGTRIAYFTRELGDEAAIVRVMPNTPAAIGRGMSVLAATAQVSPEQRTLTEGMMAAVGAVAWLEDEDLMDAVTAISGSGPAYVFLLVEAMAEAGRKAGLPDELASRLALETVAGAGELARGAADDPATLRRNVTSPGGTTAAALDVLMADDGLQALMDRAVLAARDRGRELGG